MFSATSNLNFTPDLVIFAVFSLAIIYGLVLGHNKIKTFALSVYVGIVLAETFGASLQAWLSAQRWDLNGALSESVVSIILFVLPLVLLEIGKIRHGRSKARGGTVMTILICLATACLLIASGLELLEAATREVATGQSWLAFYIYKYRTWFVAAVPVAIITENLILRPRDH